MILYLIIKAILNAINSLLDMVIPIVEELPFGLETFFLQGVYLTKQLAEFFPLFGTLMALLTTYITFLFALWVIKLIMGSRSPVDGFETNTTTVNGDGKVSHSYSIRTTKRR